MLERIQETATFLKGKMHTQPETAIILGTGLGSLVNEITDKYEIAYKDIPNFPLSTVEGHSGKLIFGKLGQKDIMAMQGRFHYYEGYTMQQVTFPVRVMRELGESRLLHRRPDDYHRPYQFLPQTPAARQEYSLWTAFPGHERGLRPGTDSESRRHSC